MSFMQPFIEANEHYAEHFRKGGLGLPAKRNLAIVTCIDARLDPAQMLGLEEGDAHIIRNAGGRASEALRSLIISQMLVETTTILILHHTDCGMLRFTDEQIRTKIRGKLHTSADHIAFLPFSDVEQSVRDDVHYLQASPLISNTTALYGYLYDVETGRIREIISHLPTALHS